jgi:hypothetical protein
VLSIRPRDRHPLTFSAESYALREIRRLREGAMALVNIHDQTSI